MGVQSKFTEEQQEHIKSFVKREISAKKIAEELNLPLSNVTYWVSKFRKELGLYTPKIEAEATHDEDETQDAEQYESTGFTVEEYNQKIIDAKDAHIKDLKQIVMALIGGKVETITMGDVSHTLADHVS